ncbi:MAG: hypothetical protein Q9194_004625 [Teloschistes cf. exilis]
MIKHLGGSMELPRDDWFDIGGVGCKVRDVIGGCTTLPGPRDTKSNCCAVQLLISRIDCVLVNTTVEARIAITPPIQGT